MSHYKLFNTLVVSAVLFSLIANGCAQVNDNASYDRNDNSAIVSTDEIDTSIVSDSTLSTDTTPVDDSDFDNENMSDGGLEKSTGSVIDSEANNNTDTDFTDTDSTDTDSTDPNTDPGTDTVGDTGSELDTDSDTDTAIPECSASKCQDDDDCCPAACNALDDNDCYTEFTYTPSNFKPEDLSLEEAPKKVILDCEAVFDSSETPTFVEWCGQPEPPVEIVELGQAEISVAILTFVDLTVAKTGSLQLDGDRPVILAVFGKANIAGVIDASSQGTTPGAGGNVNCTNAKGGNGTIAYTSNGSGGGGGGFGTKGGLGGVTVVVAGGVGGLGGSERGTKTLTPLLGGCPGGTGGGCKNNGAAGGGALQISTAGILSITGTIKANGGEGIKSCNPPNAAGSGGGSGGGILLEGHPIAAADTATLEAKGGNGGHGGNTAAGGAGAEGPDVKGAIGRGDPVAGAGGAGGGYGRIQKNSH
jgi:hypothetical protein